MEKFRHAIYKLEGVIKNYDWGGKNFLANLLSIENPEKQPMAEYWLGAHHLSPSFLITEKGRVSLNDFIDTGKEKILGKKVSAKFHNLPYLFKILDVQKMLSIQVHPSKHAAEVEYARENREGIPFNAAHRNYRDDNHKPELIVALSDFWLLHGFKPVDKLVDTLKLIPEFQILLDIFNSTGYDQLYKTVMEMPQQSVNEILQPLLDRIIPLYQKNELVKTDENFWACRAAITIEQQPGKPANHIDRGIYSIYFFNLIRLNKGEGIFQDAGVPHSYLEGKTVEIMANSDNVLRGGLTTKHIDVKELMKHVKFEETQPEILHPHKKDHEKIFITAAPDFVLSEFELKEGESSSFTSVTAEIVFVTQGKISLASEDDQVELSTGEAGFILASKPVTIISLSDSEIFHASVPVHPDSLSE